jgi:hypothetical protein
MPMGLERRCWYLYSTSKKRKGFIWNYWFDAEEAREVLIKASKKLSVKARVVAKWEIR